MGKVILDMSMSLDGFIASPKDNRKQGLGEGGEILHEWLFNGERPSEFNDFFKLSIINREVFDKSFGTIGAIVAGRRTYDLTCGWGGSHPIHGIPVFIPTHDAPKEVPEGETTFTFVSDGMESVVEQAKTAADDKDVQVMGGANTAQQCMKANLVDEILIHLVPVLLGKGIRLFDSLGPEKIHLEKVDVTEASDVTHLRYRILK
ncbi:Dihydrofolate reductase [Thalassobacillus cyri]|uniref:Dihydrofolate reductase n=1 Tax=Thalassobacillus cyri TaxID=571932 RepID=A0A1H3W1C8_9BACI|nr:dihydrofolate reductase family protein [Thalassobacillus cyri]SDZ80866.1 Dihydrofolate reductase [Thalassobacillus cyri]